MRSWRGRRRPDRFEAEEFNGSRRQVSAHLRANGDIRGEATALRPSMAFLTFRATIPSPSAVIPQAEAPGASTISSATDGNGPARRLRRFPGFRAMASYPEYSADFFDGEHMVLKGASPVTAADLLRPTFRNWFRPRYPYVYATFRCVTERPGRS